MQVQPLSWSILLASSHIPFITVLSRRNIVAFKGTGRQEESEYLMQEYIVGGIVHAEQLHGADISASLLICL